MNLLLHRLLIILFVVGLFANSEATAPANRLHYTLGKSYHVQLDEMLKLTQQISQVDSAITEPSWRYSTYHFTEMVQSVNPDGSAVVASTLDSFITKIYIAKVTDRNEFFRFNSNNEGDINNRLHDARALPRAQYLGQTLIYTLNADGSVRSFSNLSAFQTETISRSYDYDMMHAMMSFTDSLRVGQLFESASSAITALDHGGKADILSTVTEIHITKEMTATQKGNHIAYSAAYTNPPKNIEYLEGISYPITIKNFRGGMSGTAELVGGIVTSATEIDSAEMELHIDPDVIYNSIYRTLTTKVTENKVLRGVDLQLREIPDSTTTDKKSTDRSQKTDPNAPKIEPLMTAPPK